MPDREDMFDVIEELSMRPPPIVLLPYQRDALVKWIRYLESRLRELDSHA